MQNGTGQNSHERSDYNIQRKLPTKEKHYHNRGEFFCTRQNKTKTPDDFWRRLIKIEKECTFEGKTAEDLRVS